MTSVFFNLVEDFGLLRLSPTDGTDCARLVGALLARMKHRCWFGKREKKRALCVIASGSLPTGRLRLGIRDFPRGKSDGSAENRKHACSRQRPALYCTRPFARSATVEC